MSVQGPCETWAVAWERGIKSRNGNGHYFWLMQIGTWEYMQVCLSIEHLCVCRVCVKGLDIKVGCVHV